MYNRYCLRLWFFVVSSLYPTVSNPIHPHQRNIASKINTNIPAPPIKIIVKIMSRPSIKYVPLVEVEGIAPSSSRFQQRVLNNNSIYYNILKIICQLLEITKPSATYFHCVPVQYTISFLSVPDKEQSVQNAVAPESVRVNPLANEPKPEYV